MPAALMVFLTNLTSAITLLGLLASTSPGSRGATAAVKAATRPGVGTRAQLDAPPIQVLLYKDVKPGAITYGYRVVNGSAFEVSSLLVGFNHYTGSPELRIAPSGWDGNDVPPTSFRTPNGWAFGVTQTEDDSLINVQWEVDTLATGLLGGTTLAGFEVTVSQADTRYEAGHWTVYLNSAQQNYFTGAIDASGTTDAPTSSVFGPNGVRIKSNPTRGGVTIEFASRSVGSCTIEILDASGRSLRQMTVALTQLGRQSAVWDGSDSGGRRAAPGAYFVWIRTPTAQRFARFVLQR